MAEKRRDATVRVADEALNFLREQRISPTPECYRVIFAHISGEHPSLTQALGDLQQQGHVVDEVRLAELHDRFFSHAGEERTVTRASGRLRELSDRLLHEVGSLGAGTAEYNSSLSRAQEGLSQEPAPDALHDILRHMLGETSRMLDHAAALESHLRDSCLQIEALRRDLQTAWREARTDGLTGLANRKQFELALRTAAAQSAETGAPVCLLLADIDHFKQFNDTHGHLMGDHVLKLVAHILRSNVKGQDLVARFGGEEFAIVLPATRLADAYTLADKLRDLVASRHVQLRRSGDTLGRVTLSMGVSDHVLGEPSDSWIDRADQALYDAKRNGRNRVVAVPGSREARTQRMAAMA
ncbi:MAG: GGDEF domain-containing protein [Geminicoccaceae bacterium]